MAGQIPGDAPEPNKTEPGNGTFNALIRSMSGRTPPGGEAGEATPPGEAKDSATAMNALIRAGRSQAD